MKKIVSALVLSLMASQASAQIANSSIQANLKQCIALAQHGMSNEEIIATAQKALDQAAHTDNFDFEVKKSDNKNIFLYIVGGVVVVGVVGAGIYYYLKKSEKPNDPPKKDQKKSTNGSDRSEKEKRGPRTFRDQVREDHERHQEVLRKIQEDILRSATDDLRRDTEFMRGTREGQQEFFSETLVGDDFMRDLDKDFQNIQADLEREWKQRQDEIGAAHARVAADLEKEHRDRRAQREAALAKDRAELARIQRTLDEMTELDRVAREKEKNKSIHDID